MAIRQQRTRNRHQPDPGQGPLPLLYEMLQAVPTQGGEAQLQFPAAVIVRELPPVLLNGTTLAVGWTQPVPSVVVLEFPIPVEAGSWVSMPDWSPSLRGENGEWVAGFSAVLGGSGSTSMPQMVRVVQVQQDGTGGVVVTLEETWAGVLTAFPITVSGDSPLSVSTSDDVNFEMSFVFPKSAGDVWDIPTWAAGAFDASSLRWLSPALGIVVA